MGDLNVYGYQNSYEEVISAATADPSVELGSRRVFKGEEYIYCYNGGTGDAYPKDGVALLTAASGYSVTKSGLTDVFNLCVGVVKHATIAASSYGWVMSKGFASVNMISATTAHYLPIALGAAGDFVEAEGEVTTAGTGEACGFALNANTGAAGLVYAFIKSSF